MLAYMTYVLSSLAQHVGFFAGQPAFSQALKRSSFISWDELSSPKKFFRFTVLGECHFVLPSMVNTNSSYKLSPSFVVKQCLAFWTESGNHRLILSVHHILDLQIIRLVKKKNQKILLFILIIVVIHNVIILLQSLMIIAFEWASLRHELSKKGINNTEPMLCALINKPKEHILTKPRTVHSICSGVKFLPRDGFHDNDSYLLPPTEKSSAITDSNIRRETLYQ